MSLACADPELAPAAGSSMYMMQHRVAQVKALVHEVFGGDRWCFYAEYRPLDHLPRPANDKKT